MLINKSLTVDVGDEPAIVADGNRQPDRRQISARWLVGACLTGLTSCTLMGVALFAAMEGREQMATPPEVVNISEIASKPVMQGNARQDRLIVPALRKTFYDRKQFEVPALQRIEDHEVVRAQNFELVNMTLAKEINQTFDYPEFNALKLFDDIALPENSNLVEIADTNSLLYGAKIETDIVMQMQDFPQDGIVFDEADIVSPQKAENYTRDTAVATGGITKIAALAYLNPLTLDGLVNSPFDFANTPDVKIIPENVSILAGHREQRAVDSYSEEVIPLIREEPVLDVLERTNYRRSGFIRLNEALTRFLRRDHLEAGSILRLGIESNRFGSDYIIRASLYKNKKHILSVALDDKGQFVLCDEPDMNDELRAEIEGAPPVIQISSDNLPTIYDAVFRSSLSYGMGHDTTSQLIRMLANDLDMQSQISPTDSLEVLYPVVTSESEGEDASPQAAQANQREILYVSANFGNSVRRYYRFQSSDGRIDYYDAQGRNSKQFLLRKPVPNGIFRSPFGPRKHPILGYVRMHSGVDWAAPRGSPIIAAGDGVVVKAGWSRGYGNHTEIRHANGYSTSYSHQSAFASGIKPGVHIRQGQIIGYVGSTGLSSGPHCHFEILVNGTQVDPMRVRLPDDNSLKGEDLVAFTREREHIDMLMKNGQAAASIVALRQIPNG